MKPLLLESRHLSLNTATLGPRHSLQQAVEGCVKYGFGGIAPWRDKLTETGLKQACRLINDAGLRVSGLCRGGMFPAGTKRERADIRADNYRAIDEAAALGAECLVLVVGGLPPGQKDLASARRQVEDGIAGILDYARAARVRLAIEPLHPMYAGDRACINTLAQALALCEGFGEGVGVAADAYHVWWDPDLPAQLHRAGRGQRLYACHICDWLVPTRHLLTDRGMMGDGVIDLNEFCRTVDGAGYSGLYEVEIFSDGGWWQKSVDETLGTISARIKALNAAEDNNEH